MKEQCTSWEQAKVDHPGALQGECPLRPYCNGEVCMNPIDPLTRARRFDEVQERQRHYSDVPAHKARSQANHL
jgi:hypothetical protein